MLQISKDLPKLAIFQYCFVKWNRYSLCVRRNVTANVHDYLKIIYVSIDQLYILEDFVFIGPQWICKTDIMWKRISELDVNIDFYTVNVLNKTNKLWSWWNCTFYINKSWIEKVLIARAQLQTQTAFIQCSDRKS